MPLAALILAQIDEEAGAASQPLLLTLGGQTLLERLVDQARRVGCAHIIVCAGPLPGALVNAVDRMRARGVQISLARSPREAADLTHPEENILLFASAFVMPDEPLVHLRDLHRPAVLTVPEAWGRDRFERIDATDNWAGVALVPAAIVRETVAMLGEWAFGPTLIRRAIQLGVVRRPIAIETEAQADEIAPIVRDDLQGTARAIVRAAAVPTDGFFEKMLLVPPLRQLAGWLALKPVSSNLTAFVALLLGMAALGVSVLGLAAIALLLLIGCRATVLLTTLLGQAGLPERRFLTRLLSGRDMLLPLILLTLMVRLCLTEDPAQPLVLLLAWAGTQSLLTLHAERRAKGRPAWHPGSVGAALVLILAFLVGWPLLGLAVVLALTITTQLWLQHRSPSV